MDEETTTTSEETTITETINGVLETIGYDVFTLGDCSASFPLDNIAYVAWNDDDTAHVYLRTLAMAICLPQDDAERLWFVYAVDSDADHTRGLLPVS